MVDTEKLKFYDRSKKGEQVTMEINVDFIDIIAMMICNQPLYKLINYTPELKTLADLKKYLKLEDFAHHPDKLTKSDLEKQVELTFNHNIMGAGDITSYIKRG